MKRINCSRLMVIAFALACLSLGAFAKIKVGVAETIITPPNPIGYPMSGYDRGKNTSTGVHDDLHARTIVVEGEGGEFCSNDDRRHSEYE